MEHPGQLPTTSLPVVRLVVAALALVVLTFGVLAWFLGPLGQTGALPTLRLVWGGITLVMLAVWFGMRRYLLGRAAAALEGTEGDAAEALRAPGGEEDGVTAAFRLLTMVGAGLAEGPGVLGAAILLLGGHRPDAALVALPVLLVLLQWPSQTRFDAFWDAACRRSAA